MMGALKFLIKALSLGAAGAGGLSLLGFNSSNTPDSGPWSWLGNIGEFVNDSVLDRILKATGAKGTEAEGLVKNALTIAATGLAAGVALPKGFGQFRTAAWLYPMVIAGGILGFGFLSGKFNNVSGEKLMASLDFDREGREARNTKSTGIAPLTPEQRARFSPQVKASARNIMNNAVAGAERVQTASARETAKIIADAKGAIERFDSMPTLAQDAEGGFTHTPDDPSLVANNDANLDKLDLDEVT